MSYATQSLMAQDPDLQLRISACFATQGPSDFNPMYWAQVNQWALAAEPGWDAAYSYALNSGTERPGWSDAVITDGMILSSVQALIALQAPPLEPTE